MIPLASNTRHALHKSEDKLSKCLEAHTQITGTKYVRKLFEPPHEKTYLLTYAPNEDSNQHARPRSLIRTNIIRMMKLNFSGYPKCPIKDSDQTTRVRRWILIFAGRTSEGTCTFSDVAAGINSVTYLVSISFSSILNIKY